MPDPLAEKLKGLVDAGWFANEDEIGRLALVEFLSRHRFELQEQFQREDISWALQQKGHWRLRRVVSDTGPVLHLHEAQALHLLALTGQVSVPPAVDDELKRWIPGWDKSRPTWINRQDLSTSAED